MGSPDETLFLRHFAATVAPRILAKVKTPLEASILDDEGDAAHLAAQPALLAEHELSPGFAEVSCAFV
jgi:hypothetical protein